MDKIRVRYAPSPTGLLHIGNARTALFNYLFAKKYNGTFIVRIEDTDILRNIEGGEESQMKHLKWLGIDYDEGPLKENPKYAPYHQLKRLDIYKKYAHDLVDMGLAYKEYSEDGQSYGIRVKQQKGLSYSFNDLVRGEIEFKSEDVEDWIILKSNGIPTYNFAVVIDDHLMEISHVLRGEEHITNTPKQIQIYKAFGWEIPTFGHMAVIVNENGKKLSKRDANVIQFISQYEEKGYPSQSLFNFISLLGWSTTLPTEVLSKEEIINDFSKERLSKAPAMFDTNKLDFLSSQYIKKMNEDEYLNESIKYLNSINVFDNNLIKGFSLLFKDRLICISELITYYQHYFEKEFELLNSNLEFLKENNSKIVIEEFLKLFESVENTPENIQSIIKQTGKNVSVKGKSLFMPIRIATTNEEHGPQLDALISLFEKEEIINRLKKVIEAL